MLRKMDVEFAVRVDSELMGTLLVSKSGLDYWPAYAEKPFTQRWKDIHEFFTGEKWQKTGFVEDFEETDADWNIVKNVFDQIVS